MPIHVSLNDAEIHYQFIRSPGPGGQNVNKLETAVQLRFNVLHSASLSDPVRERLIALLGKKLTREGDLIIKASRFRTQERNKQDALERLLEWIRRAMVPRKKRKKTQPTFASKQRRMDTKKLRGKTKVLRTRKATRED